MSDTSDTSDTSEQQKSSVLPRILLGIAIGAAAIVIYNRRGIFTSVSGPQPGGQLPAGSSGARVVNEDGTAVPRSETITFEPAGGRAPRAAGAQGAAIQAWGRVRARVASGTAVARASSTSVQGTQGFLANLLAPIQRYIASARAQLDVAIAEGQAQAARTRTELEARFEEAKKDPARARSAFM